MDEPTAAVVTAVAFLLFLLALVVLATKRG